MNDNLMNKSLEYFKETVPLMMRYQVAPTPSNYTLWYTYVSKEIPALNIELDYLLEQQKICPPIQSQALYRTFISDSNEVTVWNMRDNIEKMLIQLDQSLTDTHADTQTFQKVFDDTFFEISQASHEDWPINEVVTLLHKIEKNALKMQDSTNYFENNLACAKNEIASLKKQLKESQKEALYDSLTGLLNRHAFDTELTHYLEQSNEGLCLLLADIDHFKLFNDKWGHLLGDQVLKAVGTKFNYCMKEGATAYRFGGEEFAVIVPCSNFRLARFFAESIRRAMEKLTLKDKRSGGRINNITLSFGVSEFRQGESLSDFVGRADKYLYKAKRLGRNRVLPI